jgi:DNA-binding MarR family transcriptional regulator
MLCPKCKTGTVRVNNLSRKYAAEIDSVNQDLLLPPTELGILQTLHVERKPMRPASIAGELDCSYQLVGWRGKSLSERGLVKRYRNDLGQRLLEISDTAEAAYFPDTNNDSLDVGEEVDPAEKLRPED